MFVRDIMTRDVITIHAETKIEKVAQLLIDNQISGVPVVDDNNKLVGIITEKDLMVKASDLKMPFYLTLFDSVIFLENPIRFNNNLKKFTATRVKEAMTTRVITVEEEAEVAEAVEIMQKHKINRVPVVRKGKLVGIVTRNDILKMLVKQNG